MEQIRQLTTQFWHYLPYLVGGVAVLVIGWLVAWLVAGISRRLVARTRVDDRLAGAMALRQMGLADEIISLAFGLTFGAVAVAAAIAFGVGGRDLAGRKLQEWEESLRKKRDIQE